MSEDTIVVSSCRARKEKLKQLIEQIEIFNAEQVLQNTNESMDKQDSDCELADELKNIKENIKTRDRSCEKMN